MDKEKEEAKKKRKGNFRAFLGKDANKYYVFKNDARRKSFHSIDSILKVIYWLAFLAFCVSMAAIGVGIALWILSYVFIIGFTVVIEENIGYKIMLFGWKVLPYALIVFVVVYLIKFVLEWLFILREMHELQKDKNTNSAYIGVGKAVQKAKLFGLIVFAISAVILYILSLVLNTEGTTFEAWHGILLIALLVLYIVNKVYSARQFLKVQGHISIISEERAN